MKFLQKFFLIISFFYANFLLSSDLQTDANNSEELLQYTECPPASALWPTICTSADAASALIATGCPALVCGILGPASIHCQIVGSVIAVSFGLSSMVLTPVAGYLWYDYLQQIKSAENAKKLTNLLKDLSAEDDYEQQDLATDAIVNNFGIVSHDLLLAHDAGYFIFKSKFIESLKSINTIQAKELRQELKSNEKIGCLAGLKIEEIFKKIKNINPLDLKLDQKNFEILYSRIKNLIDP